MSIEDRPYIGTWSLNNQALVRHTPDALVYVNGNLEIAGCPTCGGRIDLQKYITAVSVDAGIETGANTASITMHIPRSDGHSFFRDGQFILRPGLEINIYFRGYFPVQGMLANLTPAETGGVDVRNSVMYPYYHVFHGVVTETSYEYAGGEHTASLSCADMLHFWSYQLMSTSGSAFGARPTNSGIKFTLLGHSFQAMTPYSIIYTLYRDVMGAAGGVAFALGQETNTAAVAESGDSMWSLALLYWEKRFSQNFCSLRMYGTNGTLYNAYQQAFVGRLSTEQTETLSKTFATKPATEQDPLGTPLAEAARLVGYDLTSTYLSAEAEADSAAGGLGINIAQMQTYVPDISSWGQVNLWESVYETKMNIAQAVTQLTGFEFYQDVTGDFIFKPPFYNLDTSSNRVFVIKDIDLISITFTSAEPEVTSLKVTSGHFGNMTGLGLENNEMGTRGEYVDYRLVAQFGWRQDTFESAYLTDPKALFFACVSRMDLFNLDMNRAQCQIPIRAELRPGFPVYLESFDCFYYLKSFSHTFSFGGQCTTSLTLSGRRGKFYAPGRAPEDGSKPTVDNIELSNPWLPPLPLQVEGNDGIPRLQGFPNVVMALDTELTNPNFFSVGLNLTAVADDNGIKALIRASKNYGVLEIDEELAGGKSERDKWSEGPFQLRTGNDTVQKVPTSAELLSQVQSFEAAYKQQNRDRSKDVISLQSILDDRSLAERNAADVLAILDVVLKARQTSIENGEETANYLDMLSDLKSSFNPGKSIPGYYRYYSSSHPIADQQGMKDILADESTEGTTQASGLIRLESPTTILGFRGGSTVMEDISVTAGLPLMRPNTGAEGARAVATPTHQIATLSFAQTRLTKEISVPRNTTSRNRSYPRDKLRDVMSPQLKETALLLDDSQTTRARFSDKYTEFALALTEMASEIISSNPPSPPTFDVSVAKVKGDKSSDAGNYRGRSIDPDKTIGNMFRSEKNGVDKIASTLATELAKTGVAIFKQAFDERTASVGAPGRPKEKTDAAQEANTQAYAELDDMWASLFKQLVSDVDSARAFNDTGDALVVQVPSYNEGAAQYTPVFPVSDERGYEVIGSYAYGRGMSIEVGGNWQEVHEANQFDFVSVDAIDAFIAELRNGTAPAKALGIVAAQDPEGAAELAAAGGTTITTQTGEGGEVISRSVADPDQFEGAFSNFVASNRQSSQKVTTTNAAYGLADMGLLSSRQVCSCKGAEADVLLVAYGEDQFLSVDQPDLVSKWLADQALIATNPWQQVQNSLRGQTVDARGNDLAQAFERAKGQFLSGVNGAVSEAGAAVGSLQDAGDEIVASINSTPDAAKSDVNAAINFFNPNPDNPVDVFGDGEG